METFKIKLITDDGGTLEEITAERGKWQTLPRLETRGKTFLGWNEYPALKYGYMNYKTQRDRKLYAISTDSPAYVIESYFREVPEELSKKRCHFRRYVLDIYLENANASYGKFKIENCNYILYYLGNIPEAGINISVDDETNMRGHAYRDVAYFSTAGITVEWKSDAPVDATAERKKIATVMLAFSKWGMDYSYIEERTSDEIIIPAYDFLPTVDGEPACVSANFYHGVVTEEMPSLDNPAFITAEAEEDLPELETGELITRFAMLSDTHVGIRMKWQNYEWLYNVFSALEDVHKRTPFDFVLQLGDNIDDGYAKTYKTDYDTYLDVIRKFGICDAENPLDGRAEGKIPHYELKGNHDTSPDIRFFDKKLWYSENKNGKKVAFIAFSTDYGGYPAVHFTVGGYESYRSYGVISDFMVEFVKESIKEAKENGADHIVLCNHFGIARELSAPILPESGLGKIENICNKYGIKLYLNGHEHNKNYSLYKYNDLYDYDAAMTRDKYAVFEIYEKYAKIKIYNSSDNSISRIDVIDLLK